MIAQKGPAFSRQPATALLLVLGLLLLIWQPACAEETPEQPGSETTAPTPLPDDATLRKMKVSQLKAMLAHKGPDAACLACTSRDEYVERIRETANWPDVTPSPSPSHADPTEEELREMFKGGKDSPDMEEIRKKLQEAGLGDTKLFTKEDLDKMGGFKDFRDIKSGDKAGATDDAAKADGDVKVDL